MLRTVELYKLEVTNPLPNTKIVNGFGPIGKLLNSNNIETFVRDGSDKVSTVL